MSGGLAHTPGPWSAIAWSGHAPTTVVAVAVAGEPSGIDTVVIAECSGAGRYGHECTADARLIAAAPDLLVAAREILSHFDRVGVPNDDEPYVDALVAAVEKAIGRQPTSADARTPEGAHHA